MRVIVVGSGPAGLTLGAGLARRGHEVVAFDRDPGPAADGTWRRRGVMQFEHAHGFRPQVRDLLLTEWPAAYGEWMGRGAQAVDLPVPGLAAAPVGVLSRRSTYERALRAAAGRVRGLALWREGVDRLAEWDGRVRGVMAGGRWVDADLVVVASGRASRLTALAPVAVGGECGMAYVHRSYRLQPDAAPGPLSSPAAWAGAFDGYLVLVFPHERGHFSVVVVRPCADVGLRSLRHRPAFEAACRAIPGLAAWTDPARSAPAGPVLQGGRLHNVYRRPRVVQGLVTVGDAVATTTPTAGRGLAMASAQIGALLALLDDGAGPATVAEPYAEWCDAHVRPWVEDHIDRDTEAVRRWRGADVDLAAPLTSAAVVDAAAADPRIAHAAGPYLAMTALPDSLAPAEPLARAVYERGWRPAWAEGPTRDELVALLDRATRDEPRRPVAVRG